MSKSRSVFLYGAGAAMEWGGLSTAALTDLVRRQGFPTKSGQKITEFIYQTLLSNGYTDSDVNFETIIHVIEELSLHYSFSNKGTQTPSISSIFLENRFENELLNFEGPNGRLNRGDTIIIPGENPAYIKHSFNDETGAQFFFQELIDRLILIIKKEILDYSFHSSGRSHIFNNPEKDEINKYFIAWIGELEKRSILRNYSLNYEPIQKFLIESAGIEVFEGFVEPRKGQTDRIRPDISRIQSDIDSNIFYNLHGSVYWQVDYYNPNSLTPPEIRLSLFPSLIEADSQSPDIQLNRGEELRIRNIITGYQKAVKTFVPPFRQMHASFDRDCIMADEIYIIGYSFGDENINQSLKSAIRYNPNVKFIIVDPGFQSNNIDNFLLFNFSPIIYNQASQTPTPKSIQGKLMQYSLFDDRMIAYACRFKEYLESANTSGNSNN